MLSQLFLGVSLVGAEWVLYLLVLLSVFSVALIIERILYYRTASKDLEQFRRQIREVAAAAKWDEALKLAESRTNAQAQDLESSIAAALIRHSKETPRATPELLAERARDAMMRSKLHWDRNLSILATIGSNAPFVGLFGTVLGIIKAFHDLSKQAGGAQTVTAGISEALVATAVGLLVAIPAVVAFNLFQRKVKTAIAQAEALKSFLICKLAG